MMKQLPTTKTKQTKKMTQKIKKICKFVRTFETLIIPPFNNVYARKMPLRKKEEGNE